MSTRIHLLLSVATLLIVLTLGWFAERFSVGFDLTANDRHSLTEGTRATLESLDASVEILAVLGPEPAVREAVTDLVARYQSIKPDVNLSFLNPDTDPARARELNAAPGGELIITGGGREQRLNSLDERSLTGALRQIGREGTKRLAFVTGHRERSPNASTNHDWLLITQRLAAIGFESSELSFVTTPVVPEDVDVLVVAAPLDPWFPGEIASLIEHVRRGGNLLWLLETSTHGEVPDTATENTSGTGPVLASAVETGPGLSLLATELGVETLPGRVIDTASQSLDLDTPDFVVLSAFPDHPVTASLRSALLLPQVRALNVTPLAGQTTLPLLASPESSWTESGALQGEVRFDENTNEVAGPLILGATIERPRIDGGRQRIAIIGDADFAASAYVGNGSNAAFIESLFVWLGGDDEALAFVTAPAPDAELSMSPRSIATLTIICLFGIPVVLLLLALVARIRMARG
jgi:hypothetical protein